jgi:gliding motility-associated-like protein
MKRLLFVGLLICITSLLKAQSDTAFWFAAPDLNGNIASGPNADRPIFLRISASTADANIIISQPANPNFIPITRTIAANTSQSIDLTAFIDLIEHGTVNGVLSNGLLIRSTAAVSCYYDIVNGRNGDIFALKGRNALGKKFTVPFQMEFNNRTNATEATTNTNDFVIVATEDNTLVTILSKNDLVGHAAGSSHQINLNRGQTYMCRAATNLPFNRPGGTIVTATKPISISVKEDLLQYPGAGCADSAGDQLISDELAGNEFIVVKGRFSNNNPDYFYIFATENGTSVRINGAIVANINAGQFYPWRLTDESCFVESSLPVQLYHISGFGCEVGAAVIPSIKCTGSSRVNVTRASGTEEFYLNVLAPKEIINDFLVNNNATELPASLFIPVVGNPQWMQARTSISATFAGTGANITITNSAGKFHAGILQGGTSSTTRYGYFSDFSVNAVQLTDPADPLSDFNGSRIVCNNGNLKIKAVNREASTFTWTGPNGFTSSGSELAISPFRLADTGKYTISTSGTGCGNALDSIRLLIDKPTAAFDYTTNGCSEDPISFTTPANAGVRWVWDFGNGQTQDNTTPLVSPLSINLAGEIPVKLKVASPRGCFSDDTIRLLKLSTTPKAIYSASAVTCVNDLISFTDASTIETGTIKKWRWNLDDGQGFAEQITNAEQTKRYDAYGDKNVRLVVESETGCISDTFRLANFTVHPIPVAGFINPEVCQNDKISQFKDTTRSADGFTAFTYQWNFNAGTNPVPIAPTVTPPNTTAKDPSLQFNLAGNYTIRLIVNARGCIDTLDQAFKVYGANPIPQFSLLQQPELLCSNDSIRITNSSYIDDFDNVARITIQWDSNDPAAVTTDEEPFRGKRYAFKYPNFQSPIDKKPVITLRAFSGTDLSCSVPVSETITLHASPKATFNTISGICLDAEPRAINTATFDPAVPSTIRYSGTGVDAVGLFDPAKAGVGTFAIQYLATSNSSSCKDSATQDITVWPLPTADFIFSDTACATQPVRFTSKSVANAGSLKNWFWDFGDGQQLKTAGENPFVHVFSEFKSYDVSLLVRSDKGCASPLKVIPVLVHPLPIPAFDLPEICLPIAKALFSNKTSIADGSKPTLTYRWDFGNPQNPQPSSMENGQHTYFAKGPFTVKLLATSLAGCSDSLSQVFDKIYAQPKAGIKSMDSLCLGDFVRLNDTSKTANGVPENWFWDFGDGSSSTLQNPRHRYTQANNFRVSHYIRSSIGCYSDTIVKTIAVFDYPKIDAGPDLMVLDDGQKRMESSASGNIVSYFWEPPLYLSDVDSLQPLIIKPRLDQEYRLTVTGRGGCISTDYMRMTVQRLPQPPNTFTPNGDGINDRWEIRFLDQYPSAVIEVYSASQQLVFRNIGYTKPWDGTVNGRPAPAGTYYYVVDTKNKRGKLTGFVTIIR